MLTTNNSVYHSAKLRVFSILPGLGVGGGERWWLTLVRNARSVRHAGFLVLNQDANQLFPEVKGIPHRFVGSDDPWKIYESGMELLAEIKGADVILMWGLGAQANTLLYNANLPSIQVSHSDASHEKHMDENFRKYIDKIRGADVHFISAVSESSASLFPEYKRMCIEPKVIHNGVELERCIPSHDRASVRARLQLSDDAKVLLYMGRFSPEKKVETAIECLQHLPNDWHIVVNAHGDRGIRERCIAIARNLEPSSTGSPSRVLFLQPHINSIANLLGMADALVLCSDTEAFPLVWIEAWIAGLRVISSHVPALDELFRVYNDGQPFCETVPTPVDPVVLAKAVLDDQGLASVAQKIALSQFCAARCVGEWEDYFHQCHNTWIRSSDIGKATYITPSTKERLDGPQRVSEGDG